MIDLISVLKQSTLLSMFALISSIVISMLLTYFLGVATFWSALDSIINTWCVVLMFSVHTDIYQVCCARIESNISDQCLSCCSCHLCCNVVVVNVKQLET